MPRGGDLSGRVVVQSLGRAITKGVAEETREETTGFDSLTAHLWVGAVVFFCVADLLTTAIGLPLEGIVEIGPVAAILYEQFGFPVMVVLKLAALAVAYLFWELVDHPHNIGIPLGLYTVGVLVTAWNLALLLAVS